jgi:hypothetical protein
MSGLAGEEKSHQPGVDQPVRERVESYSSSPCEGPTCQMCVRNRFVAASVAAGRDAWRQPRVAAARCCRALPPTLPPTRAGT